MNEWTEEEKKKWVEKQVEKFTREMKAQVVEVDANVVGKGEIEAEKLRIEMEKEGETADWARREVLKQDIQKIREEFEEDRKPADPIGSGGSGTIPLSKATGSDGVESWDSYEAFIDDLRRANASGNKRAKLILNELFHKTLTGQRAPLKEMTFVGEKDVEGKEKGLFETMREEFRKRKLAEKRERDEQQ